MTSTLCAATLFVGYALLGSCAAPGPAKTRSLEIIAKPQFQFRARVASPEEAWKAVLGDKNDGHFDLVHGSGPETGSRVHASAPPIGPPNEPPKDSPAKSQGSSLSEPAGPYVEVRCTSLALSPEQAATYLGWGPDQAWALLTERESMEQGLQEIASNLPGASQIDATLHIVANSKAHLSQIHQSAFVGEYDLSKLAHEIIADPQVGVLGEGLSFALLAEPLGQGQVSLRIDLAASDLQQPHKSSDFRLPSGAAVTLQQPLLLAQSLQTSCEMNSSQALLLVMLGSENSGELLFTVLTVQPYRAS